MSSCDTCNLFEGGFCTHWKQEVPAAARETGCEAFRLWRPEGRFTKAKTPEELVEITWRIDPGLYDESALAEMWAAFYARWKKVARKGEKIRDFLILNYAEEKV